MNKTVVLKSILWLCLGIIFILPVFLIIMNAFKPNNDILTSFISFPKSLYLENFSEAMRIMNFWTVFRNTLFVTVCTVIVASAVSFMSAYGISHLPQKTGDKLYTLFVVGQIIPCLLYTSFCRNNGYGYYFTQEDSKFSELLE